MADQKSLPDADEIEDAKRSRLQRAIDLGIAQLERGEFIECDEAELDAVLDQIASEFVQPIHSGKSQI